MPQLGFESKLLSDQGAHFIPVPADVVARLGSQRRHPVRVTINGYRYLTMVAVSAGRHFIGIRPEGCAEAGIRAGDALRVELEYEAALEVAELPPDLQAAVGRDAALRTAFEALSSEQRWEVVAWISEAKRGATRQRRLEQALRIFGSRRARRR